MRSQPSAWARRSSASRRGLSTPLRASQSLPQARSDRTVHEVCTTAIVSAATPRRDDALDPFPVAVCPALAESLRLEEGNHLAHLRRITFLRVDAARREPGRNLRYEPPDDVEPVRPAEEGDGRLMVDHLFGKLGSVRHPGRVRGDDPVAAEPFPGKRREEIASETGSAPRNKPRRVLASKLDRLRRDVGQVHVQTGPRVGDADPGRADPASEVEREPARILGYALEPGPDEDGQVEPRDEPAPIDLEAKPEDLHRSDDVAGRLEREPAIEDPEEVGMLARSDALVLARIELRGDHPERERDQLPRLLARILAEELGSAHPLGRGLDQFQDRGWVGGGVPPQTFRRVRGRVALAHCPAPACSAPWVRFCSASAWK